MIEEYAGQNGYRDLMREMHNQVATRRRPRGDVFCW